MKYFILTAFVALASIGLQSCSGCKNTNTPVPDNPYGLPNATQTGANIFACRINGQNFIAEDNYLSTDGGIKADTIGITGRFNVGHFFYLVSLGVFRSFKENVFYNLSDTIHTYCLFGTDSTCQNIGRVTDIYPKIGNLLLTKIDTANKILSGTFMFNVPIPNCDTLKVTDGRFDIKYN